MDTKDWISCVCTILTTATAIITLIVNFADKKKTAKRSKPGKRKRKR